MSRCYYYSDIAEMIETLLVLDREVETIATEMIGVGMSISGFHGITARKIQDRFLSDYSLLKQNQIRTRENTFKVLQYISDIFLEIDSSPWAVIHFDQLERNDQYIVSMLQELEEEIINYNQLVSRAALDGLYLETISRSLPDIALEDLKDVTWKLSDRLQSADKYASNAIRELLSDYEDMIVKILCMFDVSVRTKLTKVVKGNLSTQMLVNIEEKVERTELEKHLRKNKAALMKELYIETEEEYEEYIKGALINLALYNKYKDRITELEQMTFEEKYEAYPLGGGNPQTELLFLMQLNGYSMEEREAILRLLKMNGEIKGEDLKRITGSNGGASFLGTSLEEAGLELLYHGSIMNMSWNEMELTWNENARKDRDAFWKMLMLTWGIKASELQMNPPASNENLDPSVRLDQMELNSQNGFKSYDYIQIPADSIPAVSVGGEGTSGAGTSTQPKTGADRANKYSSSWSDGSVKEAVENIAPDSTPQITGTGKIIYSNLDTNQEVVYDIDGNYYRIIDNNITGKRNALDINGDSVSNNIILENGKQQGLSQSQYNSMTHFNNTDMDFPYDR